MDYWNAKLSQKGRQELEELIVFIIKSGLAEKPEDVERFMRLRSSLAARKALEQGTPFFECEKCGSGKKTNRSFLAKIHKVPMSKELRKFLRRDPEKGMRDALSHLLDIGKLYVGRGWTIKIPTPPK